MVQLVLLVIGVILAAAIVFGVALFISGDQGLGDVEPDGCSVPLPEKRPLEEDDISVVRFDVVYRGYRMAQVDRALRRSAYDIGYKNELIQVLEAEIKALREGRNEDADRLQCARQAADSGLTQAADGGPPATVGITSEDNPDNPDNLDNGDGQSWTPKICETVT